MPLLNDHVQQYFREDGRGDDGCPLEHQVGRPSDEVEAHVLQTRRDRVGQCRYCEIVELVGCFSRLERHGIALPGRQVAKDAQRLSHEHGKGLHVGVEKMPAVAVLLHVLTPHQLVC
jgi:hypothetical protein